MKAQSSFNNKQLFLLSTLLIILVSCSSQYFKKLSDYTIQQDKLANHSLVNVIYSSDASEDSADYYSQYIVIMANNPTDTFRILSPLWIDFKQAPNNKTFVSISSKDKIDMLLILSTRNDGDYISNINQVNSFPIIPFDKVVCNKKYSDIEDRNLPTVIGYLTDMSNIKN
jgi:hypothetical protein